MKNKYSVLLSKQYNFYLSRINFLPCQYQIKIYCSTYYRALVRKITYYLLLPYPVNCVAPIVIPSIIAGKPTINVNHLNFFDRRLGFLF